MTCKILIIDHDPDFLSAMARTISGMKLEAVCAQTLPDGLSAASSGRFGIVVLNSEMPEGRGIEVLGRLKESPSRPEILIVSDSADPDDAELAIQNGAWDYIEKPREGRKMALPIVRLMEYLGRSSPGACVQQPLKKETYEEIAGHGARIKASLELVALAANGDASVLISGETGTGKELFAWAIHNNSARASQQFVVVDCASLPPSLVESTLFGYEKGAFTGADRPHKGLIKRADGGTLFLDEIGELPVTLQKSFLRVLQERRFRPVGGAKEVRSNFRLIAATNRNLEEMVKRRQFRSDLLFRIRAFSMELPPLRERPEDIRDIAVQQMGKICRSYGSAEKEFSPDFFDVLEKYPWPGNVRELVNALERAISAARNEPVLFPKHLPTYIRVQLARASVSQDEPPRINMDDLTKDSLDTWPTLVEARETAIAHAERNYLKTLMSAVGGDVNKAINISGLSRSRLYALMKKHKVSAAGSTDSN